MLSRQLWFTAPGQVEVREHSLPDLQANQVLVESLCSAISTGTELLVFRNQLPEGMPLDTTIENLKSQSITYPLQYGYATVGIIQNTGAAVDRTLIGKTVFAYAPHASHSIVSLDNIVILPDDMKNEDAAFLANMETAVNLVQDGAPLLGESVAVIGIGTVGLLTCAALETFPLSGLYALDNMESRRKLLTDNVNCIALSSDKDDATSNIKILCPQVGPDPGVDLCIEVTGNPDALNLAIELCAYDGRIVVGSWYGNKSSAVNLGGKFHRNRLNIISSQVSTISSNLLGRWNKKRRLEFTCKMINKIRPGKFINKKIQFEQAQQAYELLDNSPGEITQVLLEY